MRISMLMNPDPRFFYYENFKLFFLKKLSFTTPIITV